MGQLTVPAAIVNVPAAGAQLEIAVRLVAVGADWLWSSVTGTTSTTIGSLPPTAPTPGSSSSTAGLGTRYASLALTDPGSLCPLVLGVFAAGERVIAAGTVSHGCRIFKNGLCAMALARTYRTFYVLASRRTYSIMGQA